MTEQEVADVVVDALNGTKVDVQDSLGEVIYVSSGDDNFKITVERRY